MVYKAWLVVLEFVLSIVYKKCMVGCFRVCTEHSVQGVVGSFSL